MVFQRIQRSLFLYIYCCQRVYPTTNNNPTSFAPAPRCPSAPSTAPPTPSTPPSEVRLLQQSEISHVTPSSPAPPSTPPAPHKPPHPPEGDQKQQQKHHRHTLPRRRCRRRTTALAPVDHDHVIRALWLACGGRRGGRGAPRGRCVCAVPRLAAVGAPRGISDDPDLVCSRHILKGVVPRRDALAVKVDVVRVVAALARMPRPRCDVHKRVMSTMCACQIIHTF